MWPPTSSEEVIDNVDNLLLRDETTTVLGVLTVLEQGTCDVLNTVLGGHKFKGNFGALRDRCQTLPTPFDMSPGPGSCLGLQALGWSSDFLNWHQPYIEHVPLTLLSHNPKGQISEEEEEGVDLREEM